ncbi:hypothetical protein [Flavobacterium caseinilyticum]|nr:hypothetical protein [Flavobacterium caseinilyticum]
MKILLVAIIVIAFLVETWLKPRIDKADGSYVIWYGIKNRNYIIL